MDPNLIGTCVKKRVEFFAIDLDSRPSPNKAVIQVSSWGGLLLIPMGRQSKIGKAGCGGLLRNCEGEWLGGFSRGVGSTSSCVTELWALCDGLNLASSLGIENLIVELDALSIVHLMRNSTANLALEPLLSDCRNLLRTFLRTQIEHVFKEANQCADALAKLGSRCSAMYVSFVIQSFVVMNLLSLDREQPFVIDWFRIFVLFAE